MRALIIESTGPVEVLKIATVNTPRRVGDEVLVQVMAAGVNPIDVKTRSGRGYATHISSFPTILGHDFAGVVAEIPYLNHPLQVGDRVFGMVRPPRSSGSYAEFVTVSSLSLTLMPTDLSFVEAAAVPVAALTAFGALQTAQVRPGSKVLIHAGSGGVGHFAVQLAKILGAEVFATCSSANKEFVSSLGADRVLCYDQCNFENEISNLDVVLDLLGNMVNQTGSRSLDTLRRGGTLVNIPTGSWPTMSIEAEAAGIIATGYQVSASGAQLNQLAELFNSKQLQVTIDSVFPLIKGAGAHTQVESGHTRGKVVLSIN